MKKLFWIACSMLSLSGCKKNAASCAYTESSLTATAAERTYIENYLTTNSLTALPHTSGVYYTINGAGSGNKPNICSNLRVKYSGYLFNGTLFDSYQNAPGIAFDLGQLIVGWQKALPLIGAGGSITLYISPSLGYGSVDRRDASGNIVIPANSYLKFDIDLLDVQ